MNTVARSASTSDGLARSVNVSRRPGAPLLPSHHACPACGALLVSVLAGADRVRLVCSRCDLVVLNPSTARSAAKPSAIQGNLYASTLIALDAAHAAMCDRQLERYRAARAETDASHPLASALSRLAAAIAGEADQPEA